MPNELEGITINSYSKEGGLVMSQTYGETSHNPVWKKRKHIANAGETTFFDIEITTEIKLESGGYKIINIEDIGTDDYIEFSIIDKNDIYSPGLFSQIGLTIGEDILEIHKFVRTEFIDTENWTNFEVNSARVFTVKQGLFLRIAYNSTNEDSAAKDIYFNSRILWDE